LKQAKGKAEKFTSEPVSVTADQSETAQDLNAAKVAAMKAAELGWYFILRLVLYSYNNISCHC